MKWQRRFNKVWKITIDILKSLSSVLKSLSSILKSVSKNMNGAMKSRNGSLYALKRAVRRCGVRIIWPLKSCVSKFDSLTK
jgi:hypothetical protein